MVFVLTVVCVRVFLPHIAMVMSWLWFCLWYVFGCFFLILPWYCHGYGTDCGMCSGVSSSYCHYGTDCGLCSDVSSSYCHGTAMVMLRTVVCVLMFLPHIAMVLSCLWY